MAYKDIERAIRALAEALHAVADLQHALVEVSQGYTFTDDWEWLTPYREIVSRVYQLTPNAIEEDAVRSLHLQALNALEQVRKQSQEHAL